MGAGYFSCLCIVKDNPIESKQKENKMVHAPQHQITNTEEHQWNNICRLGGAASLLQLVCLVISIPVAFIIGVEPTSAGEYFKVFQNDRLLALVRLDFATLLLLCLFPLTSFGIYAALRRSSKPNAALATALVFGGMLLALANHSAFSIIRLGDQYASATSAAQQEQIRIAGEAVIASNMWNSTAGFLAGIFMQGGFVFISIVMLRSKEFSKGTAYSGILANGLDLAHVFVALFSPSLATVLLSVGGVFYLAWFPLLARDLIRQGRDVSPVQMNMHEPLAAQNIHME